MTLKINPELYQELEKRFKDDPQGMDNFINDAIKHKLTELSSPPLKSDKEAKDDLESYLQKGSSGNRTYGVKGQGW